MTEVVRELVNMRDAVLVEIAGRFTTTGELVDWIRSLPQRDDYGDPKDGPKVDACTPPQRLRIPAPDPNCVERSALLLGAAELIDPVQVRRLATVDTPNGRHTFPLVDGEPVVLDPTVTRNALRGALFQLDPRPIRSRRRRRRTGSRPSQRSPPPRVVTCTRSATLVARCAA